MDFELSEKLREHILKENRDFRVCTSCFGPTILPVGVARVKPTDHKVAVAGRTLYVSAFQARWVNRFDETMLNRTGYR